MIIYMKAIDHYRKPDVEYECKYDKEFFADLFCKYYAITGRKNSLILFDPDFIDEILQKEESREFLSLPSPRKYIQFSVQVAEDMTMRYNEEFKNKMSFWEKHEQEPKHVHLFNNVEKYIMTSEYKRYKLISYLLNKLHISNPKLRALLINKRAESMCDDLQSYEGRQFMKFLRICNRLRKAVKSEDVYYTHYYDIFQEIENRGIFIDDIVPKEKYEQFKACVWLQEMFPCPTIGQRTERHIPEKPHLFKIKNKEAMKNAKTIKDKWEVWVNDDTYDCMVKWLTIKYRDEWDYVKRNIHSEFSGSLDLDFSTFLYHDFLYVCRVLRENVDLSKIECHTPNKVFELIDEYGVDISDIIEEDQWEKMKKIGQESWKDRCPEIGKDSKLYRIFHKTRRRFRIYSSKSKQRKHDMKWDKRFRKENMKSQKYSMRHIGT